MATTTINTYAELGAYIDGILKQNGDFPVGPPHALFWDTLSYDQFVNGNVPNVTDPTTGKPVPILVSKNSANSNIVLALRGEGPLFDPNTGAFGQMPAGGTPFTSDQIAPIAAWIDAGCPNS